MALSEAATSMVLIIVVAESGRPASTVSADAPVPGNSPCLRSRYY